MALILLVVALLTAACSPLAAPLTAPPPARSPAVATANGSLITVSVAAGSADSLVYLPLDVARTLKYFEAEGLDVNLRVMPGSEPAASALLSGSAIFSGDSFDRAITAQAQGKDLKMIVSFARCLGLVVMVRADLKDNILSPADFKGRKIGVTSIGGATHVLAATLAERAGLTPGDYTIVPVGSSTMAAAFENQDIDVGINADPFATQLLQSGTVVSLADLRTQSGTEQYLGGEFQFSGLLVDGATIKSKPQIVQKMVNAIVKAMAYMQAHSVRELAGVLPDDVTGKDKQLWIDAYSASAGIYPPDSKVSQEGVENAVNVYRLFGIIRPGDKIDTEALYDNSFVDTAR